MLSFVLNPRYKLVRNQQAEYKFLLEDSKNNEFFTINESIFSFLKLFRKPISFLKVVNNLAKNQGISEGEAQPIVESFLNDMLIKGIIIKQEAVAIPKQVSEEKEATTFEVEGYETKKLIADNNPIYLYKAIKKESKEAVMFKVLDATEAEKKKTLKAFLYEFRILEKLKHENIITLIGVGANYGILEYFEGKSLSEIIEQPIEMKFREAIAKQIISGLAHIHQQGIIHGDLHPNNILINKQFRLKIIDFDLATNVSNKTSRYGGIREFLAPELINQDDLIDFIGQKPNKRSEVYQIGILIYFTLYGKFPIDEATWKNHLIAMKNNTISFEKTNQYGQIIEDKYINLLKRCLYFEPKSRPSSALKALKILHF